jgi:hypothetical protein
MHDSDCYLGEVLQKTGVCLAFLLCNFEVQFLTGLHYPCSETISGALAVTWRCQFVTYYIPTFYHITGVRIIGKNLLLAVWFVARPVHIWVK